MSIGREAHQVCYYILIKAFQKHGSAVRDVVGVLQTATVQKALPLYRRRTQGVHWQVPDMRSLIPTPHQQYTCALSNACWATALHCSASAHMSVCSVQLKRRRLRIQSTNNTCSAVQLCRVRGALNLAAAAAAGAPDAPAPAVRLPSASLPAALMAVRGWGGSAGAGTVALRPDVLYRPDHVMPPPQVAWTSYYAA